MGKQIAILNLPSISTEMKNRNEREDNAMSLEEHTMKRKTKGYHFIPKFGCLRTEDAVEEAEKPAPEGGVDFVAEAADSGRTQLPSHLIVMVNGIIGSADNWRYSAKQFVKAYPNDVEVHCSESNSSMLTFDGVDVMGKRLAEEVISVVGHRPNLQKISFVSHSLGGLVARFAIAELYQQSLITNSCEENSEDESLNFSSEANKLKGNIAGLEPVNFITSATPHLGSRGHKQVPVLCGFRSMEKLALHTSWVFGRTGKHLFLRDRDSVKPPLLLRMSTDSDELKFISALESFKRRVVYANACFDHLVGWSTSSLRRRHELPKRRSLQEYSKYPHIVNEEKPSMANPEEVTLEDSGRGRSSDMEETMIRGLAKLSWERVDVNFSGSVQRFLAHNTIQVKTRRINGAGMDVIQHMIDKFLL